MEKHTPGKPKRLFSILALLCLLICLPLARGAASRVASGNRMADAGGPGIFFSMMTALLLSGLILGQIALFRGEKPWPFPAATLVMNAAAFVMLVAHLPR